MARYRRAARRGLRTERPYRSEFSPRSRGPYGFGEFVRAMVAGSNDPNIRAALSEGSDSAGGYTVPTRLLQEFIDRLRSRMIVIEAGARTVVLDTNKTSIARVATDPTPSWRAENAAVAESEPTFEKVDLAASIVGRARQSEPRVDGRYDRPERGDARLLRRRARRGARSSLLVRDRNGSGTEGIFNTSGINTVAAGGPLTNWSKLLDAI